MHASFMKETDKPIGTVRALTPLSGVTSIMRKKKIFSFIPACFLVVLLTACVAIEQSQPPRLARQSVGIKASATDNQLRDKIVGTWKYSFSFLTGITIYNESGAFKGMGQLRLPDNEMSIYVKGTWAVQDGKLIETVTESSSPEMLPVGKRTVDEIVSVTANKLTIIAENGDRVILTRKLSGDAAQVHRELVEEFLKATRAEQMVERIFSNAQKDLLKKLDQPGNPLKGKEKEEFKREIMQYMKEHLSWSHQKDAYIDIFSDVYTDEELIGLIEFHKSPLGQKVLDKSPELMERSMQLVQEQLVKTAVDIQKLVEEYREKKPDKDI